LRQAHRLLARVGLFPYIPGMSTVAEIEAAIERLKPAEVAELAVWLEEYQQMVNASSEIFAMYDREEAES
jgi:hypothetical protein